MNSGINNLLDFLMGKFNLVGTKVKVVIFEEDQLWSIIGTITETENQCPSENGRVYGWSKILMLDGEYQNDEPLKQKCSISYSGVPSITIYHSGGTSTSIIANMYFDFWLKDKHIDNSTKININTEKMIKPKGCESDRIFKVGDIQQSIYSETGNK